MLPDDVRNSVHSVAEALDSLPNAGLYFFKKINMLARSAVILFFVLSGFVLARSLEKGNTPFFEYLVRRFFRIYPVLFLIIMISFFLHKEIGYSHEALSSSMKRLCNPDLSLKSLLKNLLLWGTVGANHLNGVIWSLVYELRISIIFPFILWSIIKFRFNAVILWMFLSISSNFYAYFLTGNFIRGIEADNFALTWLNTLYFIIFFAAGAYLSINSKRITFYLSKFPFWLIVLFSIITIYSLLKSNSGGIIAVVNDYINGFGAVALIALVTSFKKLENALNHKIPVWLGRISYSLYLVHFPIIYVIIQTLPSLSLFEVSIVALAASLFFAHIMTNLVEFPMNDFGKNLSRRLNRGGVVN